MHRLTTLCLLGWQWKMKLLLLMLTPLRFLRLPTKVKPTKICDNPFIFRGSAERSNIVCILQAKLLICRCLLISSGYTATWRANKRIGQAWRRRLAIVCDHMFLLCDCGPYVSIVWPSVSIVWVKSICYESYHLLQNHLLVGASLSAVCFYCVGQKHLFLLW